MRDDASYRAELSLHHIHSIVFLLNHERAKDDGADVHLGNMCLTI